MPVDQPHALPPLPPAKNSCNYFLLTIFLLQTDQSDEAVLKNRKSFMN